MAWRAIRSRLEDCGSKDSGPRRHRRRRTAQFRRALFGGIGSWGGPLCSAPLPELQWWISFPEPRFLLAVGTCPLMQDLPGNRRARAAIRSIETSLVAPLRKGQAVREDRRPFTATGCSGNSDSWAFPRSNIARIYCFLRMSTMIAYPVEHIEPSLLNLSNSRTSFQRKHHVPFLLLACMSLGT